MKKQQLTHFARITTWEFIQNFPIILGFTLALDLAQNHLWFWAIVVGFIGSLIGALVIRWTEAKIVPGSHEASSVTITNIFSFTLATLITVSYLLAFREYWLLDVLLGVILGVVVGLAQDFASPQKRISYRHMLALVCAFVPGMMVLRGATDTFDPFLAALLITFPITLLIVMIEYINPA